MATVAAGAAAYRIGVHASPPVESPAPHWTAGDEALLDLRAAPVPAATPPRSGGGAVRVELRLLEQARLAVAREDFVRAIELLAEHARRFRTGRLVEERKALRIKSLAGLGRGGEARRAAADFEANYPRSPLLPAVRRMLDSEP